jgi:hypothetical protein
VQPEGPSVFQATPSWQRMPTEGIRLPVPRRDTVAALLAGRRPVRNDRWIGAWARVWRGPWTR